jgi:hypothetical protein
MSEDGGIPIAVIGAFVSKLVLVTCSMFGTMLVSDNYEKEGEKNYEKKAKDLLGIIFLIENLIVVPLCLIIGYLGDKTKVWKGLALNLFLGCLCGFSFLYFALENGYGLFVSFIGFMLSGHLVYMQVR